MSNQRRNLYFYYTPSKEKDEKVQPLKQLAVDNNFTIVEDYNDANIIISVGGDGAFLQSVRKTGFRQDCLYLGVKEGDEAGLYCDFSLDNYEQMVTYMMNDEIEVRRFPLIEAKVNNESTFLCLNECSVRSSLIKTIDIDVHIDDLHFEHFRGDGLIVSTPTGSTGYNKSTKGAVVDPLLPSMQVSELASLNNNRFRTLDSSFILGKERKLRLDVRQDGNDFPIIGMDNEAYSIRNIRYIDISLSDKLVKTVKLKSNSFWHRVQRTFL
ncbi:MULTISPECIES: NAD kinase [Salimicrobium]|uniref:NAD kinase n=2 Tax=Salimicrobium TaxID=351195 RepID=A0ABY1KS30_9BACI|nr:MULTISPECIES: NAD kinase [Salimicrobium]SDX58841.1 NAD+ kinase [Salimicrobium album]SIS49346.1 NAD+ kinase [Salimicrobium salexigens]